MYLVQNYSKWESGILLRASCRTLEIKEFRCYKAKIEESEKVYIENCEGWWLSGYHACLSGRALHGGSSQRCPGFDFIDCQPFSLCFIFTS